MRELVSGSRQPSEDNTGFGIANAAERLRLNFGEKYTIRIDSTYGEGTKVTVYNPSDEF